MIIPRLTENLRFPAVALAKLVFFVFNPHHYALYIRLNFELELLQKLAWRLFKLDLDILYNKFFLFLEVKHLPQ